MSSTGRILKRCLAVHSSVLIFVALSAPRISLSQEIKKEVIPMEVKPVVWIPAQRVGAVCSRDVTQAQLRRLVEKIRKYQAKQLAKKEKTLAGEAELAANRRP